MLRWALLRESRWWFRFNLKLPQIILVGAQVWNIRVGISRSLYGVINCQRNLIKILMPYILTNLQDFRSIMWLNIDSYTSHANFWVPSSFVSISLQGGSKLWSWNDVYLVSTRTQTQERKQAQYYLRLPCNKTHLVRCTPTIEHVGWIYLLILCIILPDRWRDGKAYMDPSISWDVIPLIDYKASVIIWDLRFIL